MDNQTQPNPVNPTTPIEPVVTPVPETAPIVPQPEVMPMPSQTSTATLDSATNQVTPSAPLPVAPVPEPAPLPVPQVQQTPADIPSYVPGQPATLSSTTPAQEKKGGNKALMIIIFVLVLLIILGVIAIFLVNLNQGPTAPTQTDNSNNGQQQPTEPTNQLTAVEFNDTLVANQTKVVSEFLKYNDEIKKTGSTLATVTAAITTSKTAITQAITNLQTITFTGGEDFKSTGIALFEFYSGALDLYAEPLVETYYSTTLNKVQKETQIAEITGEFTAAEKPLVDAFLNAQKTFATANGITLVDDKAVDVDTSVSSGLQVE